MLALQRLACRYREQLPALAAEAAALGLQAELEAAARPVEPPRPETLRKLVLLQAVTFGEPRQVGKRTFDDRAFHESLRRQAEGGRPLSPKQVHYLDRLVLKYAGQIPDFAALAPELGLAAGDAPPDIESAGLLQALRAVKEWKPPVQRGRREWDDRKFFESLAQQFEHQKRLSPKQVASLKRMAKRYAGQLGAGAPPAAADAAPPA